MDIKSNGDLLDVNPHHGKERLKDGGALRTFWPLPFLLPWQRAPRGDVNVWRPP